MRWPVYRVERCESTQELASELLGESDSSGVVVVAGRQTAGRGRMDREWASPPGGLYFSLAFKPKDISSGLPLLVIGAGAAVSETLNEALGVDSQVKWPNDVLLKGKKVAGILANQRWTNSYVEETVLGIGVNANTDPTRLPNFSTQSTTLAQELGREVDLDSLLELLLSSLDSLLTDLEAGRGKKWREKWLERTDTVGRKVEVEEGEEIYTGTAEDLTPLGELVVSRESGEQETLSEASLRYL